MIIKAHKDKINFINVDVEQETTAFVVSCSPENDIDNLYQYFLGFGLTGCCVDSYKSGDDAYWHYQTGQETVSITDGFYSKRFDHWAYFMFKLPDDIDEETKLYFELKYGS